MSDHTFGRKHAAEDMNPVEELKSLKQRLAGFEWDDSDDDETSDMPSVEVSAEEISLCSESIDTFLCENISFENFDPAGENGAILTIELAPSVHKLLNIRFSPEWNLDSRITLFDSMRDSVGSHFSDSEKCKSLLAKVQEILPASHRKKFSIAEVMLHDDAFTLEDDSDAITAEILLDFRGV